MSQAREKNRSGITHAAIAAATVLMSATSLQAADPAAPKPLNIVLITADDLGMQLNCYGDHTIATPNLDRLAAEGCRFTNGYVAQPSCSPSRSTILTGLYPHQNGQIGLANKNYPYHMNAGVETLPAMLKKAGYRTGIIGKLHVNPADAFPFDYAHLEVVPTRTVRNVAVQAEEFVHQSADQPFFLMVNYFDPHMKFIDQVDGLPVVPLGKDNVKAWEWQQIDTPEERQRIAGYYNCIARVDIGVGLLMEKLVATGHREDTVVIFLSDNGPPFCRGKTTCYETGVHLPFIARWPGSKAGVVSDAMVSSIDLVPTMLEAAKLPPRPALPGRSLRPLLAGENPQWRSTVCTEHTTHGPPSYFPRRAIHDGHYSLIVNLTPDRTNPTLAIDGDMAYQASRDPSFEGTSVRKAFDTLANPPAEELYDTQRDPIQFENLAGKPEYKEIQDRLRRELDAWRHDTNDPLLDPEALRQLTEKQDAMQTSATTKPNPGIE